MDDIEPASPFRRDGITHIPLTRRPLRPTVGRQHFPIRDLRAQPAADSSALERDMAWLPWRHPAVDVGTPFLLAVSYPEDVLAHNSKREP